MTGRPMPCPAQWPPYEEPLTHDLHALAAAEEAAYRARRAEQERLAQAEIADLLREQDEEREEEGHDEPRCWGGEG